MENFTNSVSWVEIPALNFERAKEFYSRIYKYDMFETVMDSGRMGFLPMDHEARGVGGAIVQGKNYIPSSLGSKVYLNGGFDLQIILDRVVPSGGEIITEKTLITEDIGYFAVFKDTEGNHVSLHSRK